MKKKKIQANARGAPDPTFKLPAPLPPPVPDGAAEPALKLYSCGAIIGESVESLNSAAKAFEILEGPHSEPDPVVLTAGALFDLLRFAEKNGRVLIDDKPALFFESSFRYEAGGEVVHDIRLWTQKCEG